MPTASVKNRGYLKIKGAASAFNFDFKDKIVLDIGSSTGGFTQYALNHGARKVIAVEKGSHQMQKPLRFDPRVELHEKTDIFDVEIKQYNSNRGDPEPGKARSSAGHPWQTAGGVERRTSSLVLPRRQHADDFSRRADRTRPEMELCCFTPDIIMADASFISLKKVLAHAKEHLSSSTTDFLVMMKPQFEAKPYQLNRGIVKNDKIRRQIIKNFEHWLKSNGFIIIKKHDNDLRGKTGNQERFYWLRLQNNTNILHF